MSSTAGTEPHYALKSDLARWSMVSKRPKSDRRLAWVNSVCLLFLVIGLVGARPKLPGPLKVAAQEESAPVIVEALPPPAPETVQPQQAPDVQPSEAPKLPLVVLETPAVNFSVPTIGTLVAPSALEQAPPPSALHAVESASAGPTAIFDTGSGGDRREPPYPELALQLGQQGSVVLLLTADEAGLVTKAELKESSGSAILDHATLDFVKRHWLLPSGSGGRLFEARISYKLQ